MAKDRSYICIDFKSFYASVECVARGLDPLTAKLVVADPERSEKTICLAISPAMKALGVKNRCRVFQIPKNIEYIMAEPRMQLYIDVSARIYGIYLKYISKDDIHVYSIDEAFLDVTDYLDMYHLSAKELAIKIMQEVLNETGITSTCGIGTNLYLAKIALDIMAKHAKDHIGILTVESYKKELWNHRPLTDFWRVGPGTVKRLASYGIYTMGQVAETDEEILYKEFGIDAELLIDHAHGIEPTTIADIKAYKPRHNCLSSGQVLPRDYNYDECRLIVKEMADLLSLELVSKGLVTQSISMSLGYSRYLETEGARGSIRLFAATSSTKDIIKYSVELYDSIADENIMTRRINISFNDVTDEECIQYDLFTDPKDVEKERRLQQAALDIKKKYGKNAILKGMNFEAAGTTRERNMQIGGHKSGDQCKQKKQDD